MFSEAGRLDSQYEQKGFVSFPHLSGNIYLVTISDGQYRLALLNRPDERWDDLRHLDDAWPRDRGRS